MYMGNSLRQSEAPLSSSPSWKELENNLTSITESEFIPRAQTAPPAQGASEDAALEGLIRQFGDFPIAHPDYAEFYYRQCGQETGKSGLLPPLDNVDTIYDSAFKGTVDPKLAREVAEQIARSRDNVAGPSHVHASDVALRGMSEQQASNAADMAQLMQAIQHMGGSSQLGGRPIRSPSTSRLGTPGVLSGYDSQTLAAVANAVGPGVGMRDQQSEAVGNARGHRGNGVGMATGMDANSRAVLGSHTHSAPNLQQLLTGGALEGQMPYLNGMNGQQQQQQQGRGQHAAMPPVPPMPHMPMPSVPDGVVPGAAGVDARNPAFQAAFQAAFGALIQQNAGMVPPAGFAQPGFPQAAPQVLAWQQSLAAQAAAAAAAVVSNQQAFGLPLPSGPQASNQAPLPHPPKQGKEKRAQGRRKGERDRERQTEREKEHGTDCRRDRGSEGRNGHSGHQHALQDAHKEAKDGPAQRSKERDRAQDAHAPDTEAAHGVKWKTVEEVCGHVLEVAQDQHGCRMLQKKFEEGQAVIALVFDEVLDNLTALMMDPFGNYLVQKLLDCCSSEQRIRILTKAASGDMVKVASNTHGTRAVQKLIETLQGREEVEIITDALRPSVVTLIKDLNGNHVVQRWLQRLESHDSQFIYDAVCKHCTGIAMHRHGCCVLQRCIDFGNAKQKQLLIDCVWQNALPLASDPFGNYVVQYVLDLGSSEASANIMKQLQGHYGELSRQKFSSNVVEKCLKQPGMELEEMRNSIVKELMSSNLLPQLLSCMFGNYVIQSALQVTTGPTHQQLVDAIRPHLAQIRNTPQGKRIMHKVNGKI